jgi:succinate-acetate transporter protein
MINLGMINALKHRPVRVLGFVAALHAMIYGLGYIFAVGGFTGTVLYATLKTGLATQTFGLVMLVTGALLAFAYVRNNPKTIKNVSGWCGTAWLFATISYFLAGAWLLALATSLPWCVLAYYLAFAHGQRRAIIAYDKTPQAEYDTSIEDTL